MFKIKSIHITDFKSIKDRVFELSDLHEIIGENSVGKTSVMEAAQFACQGGKADVTKIRVGAKKAWVRLLCEKDGTGDELSIETSIDRKGVVTCKVKFKDLDQANPRTFIRKIISFGSFDPREFLDKKTREERILKLLPVKLTQAEVVTSEDKPFPVQDWDSIPFDQHAWEALKAIREDLVNHRVSLHREKEKLVKSCKHQQEEFQSQAADFLKTHSKKWNEVTGIENLAKALGEATAARQHASEQVEELLKKHKEHQSAAESCEQEIEITAKEILAIESEIEGKKRAVAALKARSAEKERNIAYHRKEASALIISGQAARKKQEEAAKAELEASSGAAMARESSLMKASHEKITALKKERDAIVSRHLYMDGIIKNELPLLRRRALDPIRDKVTTLDFTEDGQFMYRGVPLDTLSGSEIVRLGMILYSLDKKGKFLFLNEAECLDEATMKKVGDYASNEGLQVVALRVADSPVGGSWKATKLTKEEPS